MAANIQKVLDYICFFLEKKDFRKACEKCNNKKMIVCRKKNNGNIN